MFLFLFLCSLGAEPPADEHQILMQRGGCPTFWCSFSSHCYKYGATLLTWADAEPQCISEGAYLVSIHSLEEHNFVKVLINSDCYRRWTWIGLSDSQEEGGWMWSDEPTVDFVFWSLREPNNYEGNENCVHNNFRTDLKWSDCNCAQA